MFLLFQATPSHKNAPGWSLPRVGIVSNETKRYGNGIPSSRFQFPFKFRLPGTGAAQSAISFLIDSRHSPKPTPPEPPFGEFSFYFYFLCSVFSVFWLRAASGSTNSINQVNLWRLQNWIAWLAQWFVRHKPVLRRNSLIKNVLARSSCILITDNDRARSQERVG